MHTIRELRNGIQHQARTGDCTIEEANAIVSLCVLALERCGLSDVAENIRGLSLEGPAGVAEVSEADLRERRDWEKRHLAGKSPEDLTPWEQERLAEIELDEKWEEERERRELERGEIAQFGEDLDGLRRWFNADEARRDRHSAEYEALLQQEQERHEREQAEIATLGEDIDGLRLWFNADDARRDRHSAEHAALIQQEQARHERERAEIAAFGDGLDIDGLRLWFDADKARHDRHPAEHAALRRQEHERVQQKWREKRFERERAEIAARVDNIDKLTSWFKVDNARPKRHPSEYEALIQQKRWRERKQRDKERPERHSPEYTTLPQREYEQRDRQVGIEWAEQARREREREEIGQFGDDLDRLRDWFDADSGRPRRHKSAHEDLLRRERELHAEEQADEPTMPAKRSLLSRLFRA